MLELHLLAVSVAWKENTMLVERYRRLLDITDHFHHAPLRQLVIIHNLVMKLSEPFGVFHLIQSMSQPKQFIFSFFDTRICKMVDLLWSVKLLIRQINCIYTSNCVFAFMIKHKLKVFNFK